LAFVCAVTRFGAILVFASLCAAAPAWADCADDLATLKAHIDAMSRTSPNYKPAKNELTKAVQVKQDELACDNAVARTWRVIRKPIPEPEPDEAQK